jgi:hypothetical protein
MAWNTLNLEAWGIISFDPKDGPEIVNAVKELDSRPDLKRGLGWDHRGGRRPVIAGLGLDFSAEEGWVVENIFERLGWEFDWRAFEPLPEGGPIEVPIQKEGILEQESEIFAAMVPWMDFDIEAHGFGGRGDRHFWRWFGRDGILELRLGDVIFQERGTPITISQEIKA